MRAAFLFFFAPAGALNLGVARSLWYGFLLLYYWHVDFSQWAEMPTLFWRPISFFRMFSSLPGSKELVWMLQIVWTISLVCSCIGIFTRISSLLAFCAGFFLIGIGHNYGKVHHDDAVVVLILGILACSKCGDAFSFDRMIWQLSVKPSGEYRWPVRTVWTLLSLVFFAAGVAKLRVSGLSWINSDNMRILLLSHQYYYDGMAWTKIGLHLVQYPWLCSSLAAATIILECGFPLALIHPFIRILFVPSTALMLVAFPILMGPFFPPLLAAFLFWIPWDWLIERASIVTTSSLLCGDNPVHKERCSSDWSVTR